MKPPGASSNDAAIEVEQKFYLRDVAELERQLSRLGAQEAAVQQHRDTYYRHPSRDFTQTREALRIRRVVTRSIDAAADDRPGGGDEQTAAGGEQTTLVTYKGPRQGSGVKARPELEWRIDPCDPDGKNLARLLDYLGLSEVFTVRKTRRSFHLTHQGKQVVVTIDDTEPLGMFAEVETVAAGEEQRKSCVDLVTALAAQLGLREVQTKSYLQMALEAAGESG